MNFKCPYCFSDTDSTRGVGKWTDDPIKPKRTFIRAVHIIEIQTELKRLEQEAGINPTTEFSVIKPNAVHIRAKHIFEIRESIEKILLANGTTKEEYFQYDTEGNKLGSQTDWTPGMQADRIIRYKHIEDCRHPIPEYWQERWKQNGQYLSGYITDISSIDNTNTVIKNLSEFTGDHYWSCTASCTSAGVYQNGRCAKESGSSSIKVSFNNGLIQGISVVGSVLAAWAEIIKTTYYSVYTVLYGWINNGQTQAFLGCSATPINESTPYIYPASVPGAIATATSTSSVGTIRTSNNVNSYYITTSIQRYLKKDAKFTIETGSVITSGGSSFAEPEKYNSSLANNFTVSFSIGLKTIIYYHGTRPNMTDTAIRKYLSHSTYTYDIYTDYSNLFGAPPLDKNNTSNLFVTNLIIGMENMNYTWTSSTGGNAAFQIGKLKLDKSTKTAPVF